MDTSIDSSNNFNDVERHIYELQSANKSLDMKRARAEQEKKHMMEQVETFRKRLAEVEHQKRQLETQNTKFRDIFIKHGQNDNEPVDTVLIKSFCDLREQIQRIVQKQYGTPPNPLYIEKGPFLEKQKAFFGRPWMYQDVPIASKKFVMRAKLFTLLQEGVFQRPNFGLGGDLEENLAKFEEALISGSKG